MRCSASSTAATSIDRRPSGPGSATSAATSSVESARRASPCGFARDEVAHLVGDVERQLAEPALLVGERAVEELAQIASSPSAFEPDHLAARQERGVDLERRVLGRRADERDRARLDVRQERVLLRLVEAMDLVEEQDRALVVLGQRASRASATASRRSLTPASTADSATKPRVGARREDARQRRLAGARRPPQDHRRQHALRRRAPRMRPGPTRCAWPTNSSRSRGRMRSASGCPVRRVFAAWRNKSMGSAIPSTRTRPRRRPETPATCAAMTQLPHRPAE